MIARIFLSECCTDLKMANSIFRLAMICLRYGQGHHPVFFNDFLMDWLKMMKPRVAVTTYANYEIVLTRRR